MTLNLFNGEPQHEVFSHMEDHFPTSVMPSATDSFQFANGEDMVLPEIFRFEDLDYSTEEFLIASDTSALLVLKNGEERFENYYITGGRNVQWISWSVAKSFVSALIGIAIEEGFIGSIDDVITQYVPSLKNSAYDGVSIKNILQMSSGARWNEDYSDKNSDIHRLGAVMSGESSLAAFMASIERDNEPGTVCQYNSADTQALGMLLTKATGRSVSSYMQEKLCEPLGMESRSYWILDHTGMELVLGGLNMSARDFAKIGELYRNRGRLNGKQIVPSAWVAASIVPDAPHLESGNVLVGGHVLPLGYGYQWWVPPGDRGEFCAIGVYNQFVYVDPPSGVVIVKLSANRLYGTTNNETENRELATIELLRAIVEVLEDEQ